jgi:hypothetical protein
VVVALELPYTSLVHSSLRLCTEVAGWLHIQELLIDEELLEEGYLSLGGCISAVLEGEGFVGGAALHADRECGAEVLDGISGVLGEREGGEEEYCGGNNKSDMSAVHMLIS